MSERGVGQDVVVLERAYAKCVRNAHLGYMRVGWVGVFHGWGVNYEEFENGPGNFSCAIIEKHDGSVVLEPAEYIVFFERVKHPLFTKEIIWHELQKRTS